MLYDARFSQSAQAQVISRYDDIAGFRTGQALLVGRWADGRPTLEASIAPARTVVGGGGIGSDWGLPPTIEPVHDTVGAMREEVERIIDEGGRPLSLAHVAERLLTKFGQETIGDDWAGFVTFKAFVESLEGPRIRIIDREGLEELAETGGRL